MSGGGMGFIFEPERKAEAQERLQEIMSQTRRKLEHALPFAMEPVVYDFAINERGTMRHTARRAGRAAARPRYYTMTIPRLMRLDPRSLSAVAPRRTGGLRRGLPHAPGAERHGADACRPPAAGTRRAKRERGRICRPAARERLRSGSARADPAGPAARAHRPGAEPPAGQQRHSRRASRATCWTAWTG